MENLNKSLCALSLLQKGRGEKDTKGILTTKILNFEWFLFSVLPLY